MKVLRRWGRMRRIAWREMRVWLELGTIKNCRLRDTVSKLCLAAVTGLGWLRSCYGLLEVVEFKDNTGHLLSKSL